MPWIRTVMIRLPLSLACLTWLLAATVSAGTPYLPADDSEVLETLPTDVFARRDGITKLRQRLSAEPNNAELAATVAQHYVGLGKSEGDPRFFGYARAAIAPWWDAAAAPSPLLRVRAKLKETDHAYREALADLTLLLEADPGDQQAWVEVANINRVLGDYDAALAACKQLGEPSESIPAMVAQVPVLAVTGKAEAAYELLASNLARVEEDLPAVVPWVRTLQAEIARALGRDADAEGHYLAGLEAAPNNSYLQRAYADYLIDQGQADEALAMLGTDLQDNGALLRAAIAARMAGQTESAAKRSQQLHDRFAETRLRGDQPHGRYEARYVLEFGEDPGRALELALANWQRQKEIRDSRNVLEAALAADDAAAAKPVIAFLKKHGTEDATLRRLVRQLEGE